MQAMALKGRCFDTIEERKLRGQQLLFGERLGLPLDSNRRAPPRIGLARLGESGAVRSTRQGPTEREQRGDRLLPVSRRSALDE